MKREDLLFALGELDEELLACADTAPRKRPRTLARFGIVGGVLAAAIALVIFLPGILTLFRGAQSAEPDNSTELGDVIITYVYITDEAGSVRIEDTARVGAIKAAIADVKANSPSEQLGTPPKTEAGDTELSAGEYRIFLYTGDRMGGEYRLTSQGVYAIDEGVVYLPTQEALAALRTLLTE